MASGLKWNPRYQRRFDISPNLVNSVKGAMKQEQTVFDAHYESADEIRRGRYGER